MEKIATTVVLFVFLLALIAGVMGTPFGTDEPSFVDGFRNVMSYIEQMGEFANTVYDLIFDVVNWISEKIAYTAPITHTICT